MAFQEGLKDVGGIPNSLIYVSAVLGFFPLLVGALLLPADLGRSGDYLTTLVIAESGVIAIVFSVVILGIQIVSSRYTSRMGRLFFEDQLLRFTGFFVALNIGFDLVLIYTRPEDPSALFNGFVFACTGLTIIALYALFLSLGRIIQRSTPEGALSASATSISLKDFQEFSRDEEIDEHPTRDLHSFIKASLEQGEGLTAMSGLEVYTGLTSDIITETDQFSSDKINDKEFEGMFKPVFDDQLVDLYFTAQNLGEENFAREILACYCFLSKRLAEANPSGLTPVDQGFNRVYQISDSPTDFDPLAENVFEIYIFLANKGEHERARKILSNYRKYLKETIDETGADFGGVCQNTLDFLPKALSRLPDEYHNTEAARPFTDHVSSPIPPQKSKQIAHAKSELIAVAIEVSTYTQSQWKNRGEILQIWEKLWFTSHLQNDKDEDSLIQIFIETLVVRSSTNIRRKKFGQTLAKIAYKGKKTAVDQAFDELTTFLRAERTTGRYRSFTDQVEPLELTGVSLRSSYGDMIELLDGLEEDFDHNYNIQVWLNSDIERIREIISKNPDILEDGLVLVTKNEILQSHGTLLYRGSDSSIIAVKLVNTLRREDYDSIKNITSRIYKLLVSRGSQQMGPHPFRMIILTPDIDLSPNNIFDRNNISVKDFDASAFGTIGLTRQTKLEEFTIEYPTPFSSDVLAEIS